jgi:predicted RND superfamily exporter protein
MTFLGLIIIPLDFVLSLGITVCTTIVVSIIINLTFTPSIIGLIPWFFDFNILKILINLIFKCFNCSKTFIKKKIKNLQKKNENTTDLFEKEQEQLINQLKKSDENKLESKKLTRKKNIEIKNKSFWFLLGKVITEPIVSIVIILVTCFFMLPIAVQIFDLKRTNGKNFIFFYFFKIYFF